MTGQIWLAVVIFGFRNVKTMIFLLSFNRERFFFFGQSVLFPVFTARYGLNLILYVIKVSV